MAQHNPIRRPKPDLLAHGIEATFLTILAALGAALVYSSLFHEASWHIALSL